MEQIHLETKNLSFTYPDGTKALNNVNLQIKKGEKIAIMGANGAGKSTLLKTILGEHNYFDGLSEIGRNLKISFYDQEHLFSPPVL